MIYDIRKSSQLQNLRSSLGEQFIIFVSSSSDVKVLSSEEIKLEIV
jgi:hypothetical protein